MARRGQASGSITHLADRDVASAIENAWRLARSGAQETLDAFEAAWRAASATHVDAAADVAAGALCVLNGHYRDFATYEAWCARLPDTVGDERPDAALLRLAAQAVRTLHSTGESDVEVARAIALLRAAEDADRALCAAGALVLAFDTARRDAEATRIEVEAARLEADAGPWFAATWHVTRAEHALYFHRLDAVAPLLAKARTIASAFRLRSPAVLCALVEARLAIALGAYADARRTLAACEPLDDEREPMWRAVAEQIGSLADLCAGRFDSALYRARRALAYAEKARAPDDESVQMRVLESYCHAGIGDNASAIRGFEHAAVRAAPAQSRQIEAMATMLRAERLADAGRDDAARPLYAAAFATLRELDYTGFLWPVPAVASRQCAHALALGVEAAWVRSVVHARALEPPARRPRAWPWACTIEALGGFEVRVNGERLRREGARAGGKPLELLTALVVLGGRGVVVDQIVRLLWPGEGRVGAQSAFDVTLSRLRKLLGVDGLLVMVDRRLSFDERRVELDRWALEAALTRAERTPHDAQALADAVDSYRGPLLPGDEAPWVERERQRLRRRVDAALAGAAAGLARAEAIVLLTRGLAADSELPLAQAALAAAACRTATGQ